jgi:hypothetical protein
VHPRSLADASDAFPPSARDGVAGGRHTGTVTSPPAAGRTGRGVVRLLNTAAGRALCLAGAVDEAAVDAFLRRYGREPARIDVLDAGSVTALSPPALQLVLDHLEAAERAGRPVRLHLSAPLERLLAGARIAVPAPEVRRSPTG